VQQPRRPLAEHHHGVVRPDADTLLGVAHRRQRLDEGGNAQLEVRRQRVDEARREPRVLDQGAVQLAAHQARPAAQILLAPGAAVAGAAGDDRIDHHALADRDPGHVRPYRVHDAGGLVTHHHRVTDARVAPGVDLEVGVADRGGGDAHDHLAGARDWLRPRPEPQAPRGLQYCRARHHRRSLRSILRQQP